MQFQNGMINSIVPTQGRILLIDDDQSILFIMAKFLQRHNYVTVSVTRAEEALKMVSSQPFDLVACDIAMPGMNGLEFLNRLKRIDPGLASVVVTGSGSVTMAVKALESGALGFVTKPFSEEELLDSIETAIQQARLVRETTATKLYAPLLESASSALLHALEAKDQDSEGHSQQVAYYSQKIAQRLGLSEGESIQIFFAGLFHDIGKIGTPDAILRKAGPLTPDEQQEMMKHPQVGAKIIETVEELRLAATYILHHHERYDGSGYPNALKGEDIPIGSRIVAVADVYQELISRRVYAEIKTQEEAIEELRRGSGTQFDPKIVEILVETLPPSETALG
jgi:putative nucleotidyltransferase with HDIG domain